jgi:hypothetical protein
VARAPLLEDIEETLDDVAALERLGVERRWPATLGALAFAVPDQVAGER